MPESFEDQLSRVRLMSEGDPTWDLSPNDQAALKAVLAQLETLQRTKEACFRYFDHRERVSLSARHAGCDSAEMGVRMALMREAKESLGMK